MKARSKQLVDRAIAAMVAAIELYNKPGFPYRAESFAVLSVHAWELLLKAKWLADHRNDVASLFVRETKGKSGQPLSKPRFKRTRSGNPLTHGADFLARKLVESGALDPSAAKDIEGALELRDSVGHFYNRSPLFAQRLQQLGAASVKNFVAATSDWFGRSLAEFNSFLMPLSFVSLPESAEGLVLNPEEKRFLAFLESLEPSEGEPASRYSVTVNIDIRFTRSKTKEALAVQVTSGPSAPAVRLTDEQIRERYRWDYARLTAECWKRYTDFKADAKYHKCRKQLPGDKRFCHIRELDPGNPKSAKKPFSTPNILQELDKHYAKVQVPRP